MVECSRKKYPGNLHQVKLAEAKDTQHCFCSEQDITIYEAVMTEKVGGNCSRVK